MKLEKRVLRFERAPVDPKWDSRSRRVLDELPVFYPRWKGAGQIRAFSTEVFWVRGASSDADLVSQALHAEILEDSLCKVSVERSWVPGDEAPGHSWWCLEKALRPGVTDNPGQVLSEAVALVANARTECRSGARLWLELPSSVQEQDVRRYADEVFYNKLIEKCEIWSASEARTVDSELFARPSWFDLGDAESSVKEAAAERIPVADLSLESLEKMSRERLWALSRDELSCVQEHYRQIGRAMSDVEIEVIAQTWSEHCKHKIFAAEIEVENRRADLDLPSLVGGVFKTYIRGATKNVPAPYLKSVFEDNAGVIRITDKFDCAIKVETHNSPSALDPYGGALTGIVGVNRDILGVGLGAHPIANLDVFCVGPLDAPEELPPRLHHPRRVLEGVRVGVEHGGNKSGIPTVTGAVVHHPGFLGKPLVFCGTIGLMPSDRDLITKKILPGDRIVMAGGRIGKDGIHGATFSSLEMNEESPVSAVQLGDPLTQRRVWDFLIEARDQGLFRAVTDNGAGGLSSSIGELARLCGERGGARMDVSLAATKYPGLLPYELTVSESQERMSFAVQPEKLKGFLELARRRGVECSVLGEFVDSGRFEILYKGETVGDLDMHFLHEGLPPMRLQALVEAPSVSAEARVGVVNELAAKDLQTALPRILSHPNVKSRRSLSSQYDHEVQARSVRKPYGTPGHGAPNDGATLRLSDEGFEGIALGLGLAPHVANTDPKVAAELALDEALRNAAVAGMDPEHAALVDNFCWPDPLPGANNPDPKDAHRKLGALVVTCKRVFDAAIALQMPFVSGKDSMKNDYRMGATQISVPPTLLITAMGKVHDVRSVPKGYASDGQRVFWVSGQDLEPTDQGLPQVDFSKTARFLKALHGLIRSKQIAAAHDVSDGGWLGATAEMLLGGKVGANLNVPKAEWLKAWRKESPWASLFAEPATSFVLMIEDAHADRVREALSGFEILEVGRTSSPQAALQVEFGESRARWSISELESAYHG